MKKSKFSKLLTRLLITLLGIAFIICGVSTIILGFLGDEATAVITSIQRELGERDEAIRGKYTYNISYTFTLPNGNSVDGNTKKVGDATFLKADGKSKVPVRYFSSFPQINTLEKNTKPGIGQLLFIGIGCFLIYIINRRENEVHEIGLE